jgi:hypothetical protein
MAMNFTELDGTTRKWMLRRFALAAELPAAVRADLTGISVGTAERWSQWAKRDWAAYVGQRTADDQGGIGSSQKLTNRPTKHANQRYD